MKYILLVVALSCSSIMANAQTTTEDAVKLAVNNLFTAMKNSDGEMLKKCFADSAVLQTIGRGKDGQLIVTSEPIAAFAEVINSMAKGDADEQIVFDIVKIDGPLAIAWTPYKFYYKGKFSHCGVNSFQLVKITGEWKIQYLIDTRRSSNCD